MAWCMACSGGKLRQGCEVGGALAAATRGEEGGWAAVGEMSDGMWRWRRDEVVE
jgi:hypothetical protein